MKPWVKSTERTPYNIRNIFRNNSGIFFNSFSKKAGRKTAGLSYYIQPDYTEKLFVYIDNIITPFNSSHPLLPIFAHQPVGHVYPAGISVCIWVLSYDLIEF